MDELRKVAETLDRDELICCLVSVEMDRDTLKEENEELKKAKDRAEQINDNAIALLECLNIPVGDIYPTDSEESESDHEWKFKKNLSMFLCF